MIKVWTKNFPIWSSSIAIQKDSPYRPFLKDLVYQIIENGQLEQIKKKWLRRKTYCNSIDDSSNRKALSMQKLVTLFAIIFSGYIGACIIFVFETVSSYWNDDTKNDKFDEEQKSKEVNLLEKNIRIENLINELALLLDKDGKHLQKKIFEGK